MAGRRQAVRASAGPRLLVARPPSPPRADLVRRFLAGLALVLAAAAVVVGLGRLADAVGQARVAAPAAAAAARAGDLAAGQAAAGQAAAGQAAAGQVVDGAVVDGALTVTVTAPSTVWDVADRVAPGASGPERAALVDRIVAANALTSMRVAPGTVLRVPV